MSQLPHSSSDKEQEEIGLEKKVMKVSDKAHAGIEQRPGPVVEATSLADHEHDVVEEPDAEQSWRLLRNYRC